MKPREAFNKIFVGMRADVHDYRRLHDLLEAQFMAALQHRTDEIRTIGEDIVALTSALDERRRERVELVRLVAAPGTPVSIAAVAQRLQGAAREAFDACWKSLEAAVNECKELNLRNCRLLMDQHDIMQRVLETEADTYAPA